MVGKGTVALALPAAAPSTRKGHGMKVGYPIGSLSRGTVNRKLAGTVIRLAPENLAFARRAALCDTGM